MIDTLVIAAAGRGTRMKELSAQQPKHMVDIAGRPFLWYVLRVAREVGFTRIIIVTGYHADAIEALVQGESDIECINQYEMIPNKYGTAVVVEAVEQRVRNVPFIVQNGDLLCHPAILRALRQQTDQATIVGVHHTNPSLYAVLEVTPTGHLHRLIEKPEHPATDLTNLGVYAFPSAIFPAVQQVEKSHRGEYEVTDAIQFLAEQGQVRVMETEEPWAHLTTPEDRQEVEQFLLNIGYL